jgi:opacity protein-like surface antigen
MKTTLIALAIATASLAAAPAITRAADNSNGGFFVNGSIGQSSLDKGLYSDSDFAYGANVGYRWALNPNVALGVEGGYTDLGDFDSKNRFGYLGLGQAAVKGWNLGVNGKFNINPQWYVSARGGLFHADTRGWTNADDPYYVDDNGNKWYAGVGFGYDFSNNMSVGLNYDYYKTNQNVLNLDPSMVSVNAEYRF